MVEARGGKVIWTGRPEQVLIGDTDGDAWDMVALVSYPSRAAFIDMVTSPSYGEAHADRERGLDRTVLLACEPMSSALAGGDEGAGPVPESASTEQAGERQRNILFITTDQQRYDSLGCNGGTVARTPVVDRLAAEGINYRRAYNQNTVCMPARSTMLTGSTCGRMASWPTASRCRRTRHPLRSTFTTRPAIAPHFWARPISSRTSTHSGSSRRTRGWPAETSGRGAASSAPSRPCTPRRFAAIPSRTTGVGSSEPPGASREFCRPPAGDTGRRHRRSRDEEQSDPA